MTLKPLSKRPFHASLRFFKRILRALFHPMRTARTIWEQNIITSNNAFDAAYYLQQYPDIAASGVSPLTHYYETGWREGRDPSAIFSTSHYLMAYPDIAHSGKCPLVHYLRHGRKEGRLPNPPRYDVWWKHFGVVPEKERQAIEAHIARMTERPVFSIIMPVYNVPEKYLRIAIESVLNQWYPHWELCIADDASPEPHVKATLEAFQQRDSRIKVIYREKNGHICEASNSALSLATGSHICLLDHDDELTPDAIYRMATAFINHPAWRFVYSDEDKITPEGNVFQPHFKPDWSPDLLLSMNYICHFAAIDHALVRAIGGFRTGYEGSQDYDLFLRCTKALHAEAIGHIPKVLYHWRSLETSTASASVKKDYCSPAGMRALTDYFEDMPAEKRPTVCAGHMPTTYRVCWPLPEKTPLVSILIPTHNQWKLLAACIDSIQKCSYDHIEILIIDNRSDDPQLKNYLEKIVTTDARVRVLTYDHPFNYSAINNFAATHAKGEILALINNDIEGIGTEWLSEMTSQALRPDIGCVGAKLLYPDNSIQHVGVIMGLGGVAGHVMKHLPLESMGYFYPLRLVTHANYCAVTAACLFVRKSVFDEVGGLNEKDLPVAFNDVDFCLRVQKAGYRNLFTPYAMLYHKESISRGCDDTPEKQARFASETAYMHHTWNIANTPDPYYNPNLSLDLASSLQTQSNTPKS